jgi:hypothetical protein
MAGALSVRIKLAATVPGYPKNRRIGARPGIPIPVGCSANSDRGEKQ